LHGCSPFQDPSDDFPGIVSGGSPSGRTRTTMGKASAR
jgi:hypothetical protein